MGNWQPLLVIALAAAVLLLAIRSAVIKHKKRKEQDFLRKLETVLQPRETVKVVCHQKKGRCILTSHRLLFDTKAGFNAVTLTHIKRVQGSGRDGKPTSSIPAMKELSVKAERDYILRRTTPDFDELAKQLTAKVKRQNEKKAKQPKPGAKQQEKAARR